MIPVLEGKNFEDHKEFVKELNKARLQNKQRWIVYSGTVEGQKVEIKTYDTGYLQILRVNGLKHSAPMDMKVSEWKQKIESTIEYHLK